MVNIHELQRAYDQETDPEKKAAALRALNRARRREEQTEQEVAWDSEGGHEPASAPRGHP